MAKDSKRPPKYVPRPEETQTLLKAELLHARIHRDGLNLRERLLSSVDRLGRLGCAMPRTANALLNFPSVRQMARRFLGFTTQRPLPQFATSLNGESRIG